jgi:hypothetical protein
MNDKSLSPAAKMSARYRLVLNELVGGALASSHLYHRIWVGRAARGLGLIPVFQSPVAYRPGLRARCVV